LGRFTPETAVNLYCQNKMVEFIKNLSWTTIALASISIIAAVTTFILTKLSFRDKRRKFLGLRAKGLKVIAAYSTLFLAFLTLIVQNTQQYNEHESRIAKERRLDSIQRVNLEMTLTAIKKTLNTQERTQDSTNSILSRQKQELDNQIEILGHEKVAIKKYTEILERQYSINKNVITSLDIASKNLKAQEEGKKVLDKTSDEVTNLNYPIARTISIKAKFRIYVKGFNAIFHSSGSETSVLIPKGYFYRNFVKEKLGKLSAEKIRLFERFFSSLTSLPIGSSMYLDSEISRVKYEDFSFGVAYAGLSPGLDDLYYNPAEEYFEGTKIFFNGNVISNSNDVNNFKPFIDKSNLYLRTDYCCDKKYSFTINGKKQDIIIVKILIPEVLDVYYGTGNQSLLKTKYSLLGADEKGLIAKQAWGLDKPEESWKFDIIKIPVTSQQ
jgi:hypothetical protein